MIEIIETLRMPDDLPPSRPWRYVYIGDWSDDWPDSRQALAYSVAVGLAAKMRSDGCTEIAEFYLLPEPKYDEERKAHFVNYKALIR